MRILTGLVVILAAACGGGDGDDSPVGKCNALLDVTCDRIIECEIEGVSSHSECVAMLETVLPCGDATSVGSTYATCMSDMDSGSCATLFPTDPQTGEQGLELPVSCNGVIIVDETARTTELHGPRSWMEGAKSTVE